MTKYVQVLLKDHSSGGGGVERVYRTLIDGPANWNRRRQNKNAESLYTAIMSEKHQQVRKLLAIDNPSLSPMKNESTRSRAVHKALEKVSKLYNRCQRKPPTAGELSKFPAILHDLLENGGADHTVRYRFDCSGSILHKLSRHVPTNVHEIFAVLANLPLTKLSDLIVAVNDGGASFIHHSFELPGFRKCFEPLRKPANHSHDRT